MLMRARWNLGDRLMVGHCPLEASIGVRIPVPQPQWISLKILGYPQTGHFCFFTLWCKQKSRSDLTQNGFGWFLFSHYSRYRYLNLSGGMVVG